MILSDNEIKRTKRGESAMSTAYQRELELTIAVLRRMRLSVHLMHPQDSIAVLDTGLRSVLGLQEEYATAFQMALQWSREKTIYKIVDSFMCHYIYFSLPGAKEPTAMVIGPYLTADPTRETILEQTERLGLGMQHLQPQLDFYAALPVISDPSGMLAVVTCLGEILWGGPESFHIVDVNSDRFSSPSARQPSDTPIEQADILQRMKQLEERYAYENELMEIVSKGLTHRAEMIMSSVSRLNYQHRSPDPLRNLKNYCIICNTLLRKAAQQGGVHPLYLDRMSSQYAYRIENAPTPEKAGTLIGDMIRGYTRLVHTHASQQYPSPVQKALAYIDANISGDLSLTGLAKLLQVSPGYLSALFHKETGVTLAEHITAQRMKVALQLLGSTRLQVQNIAQLSGFADPNYFSRQFKRYYGVTPLQYRSEQHNPPGK